MVRLEPRNPPPPVNFVEWDGLIRLLFNRKNKTCFSSLREKKVLRMLEENYKTACAISGMVRAHPLTNPAHRCTRARRGRKEAEGRAQHCVLSGREPCSTERHHVASRPSRTRCRRCTR